VADCVWYTFDMDSNFCMSFANCTEVCIDSVSADGILQLYF
jgi:hypothetical protein